MPSCAFLFRSEYLLHNDGRFKSFAHFKQTLSKKDGFRVDHVGGCPEETDWRKLCLQGSGRSAAQGRAQCRAYQTRGTRALLQRKLMHAQTNVRTTKSMRKN